MTRIISGLAGSLRLDVPKSGTRPTSDRVREAMFSSLTAWGLTDGVRVLDLFAGSGALGLEAGSRGASSVTLVEKYAPAAAVVQQNVNRLTAVLGDNSPRLSVHRHNALTFMQGLPPHDVWDVVFIDPPYEFTNAQLTELLDHLIDHVVDDGLVMVERSSRDPEPAWPEGYRLFKKKQYGETTLWWIEPVEARPSEA